MDIKELNEHLQVNHGVTKDLQDWSAPIFHAHQHCNEDHKSCNPSHHTDKCDKLDDWFLPTENALKNYPDNYKVHNHTISSSS